MEEKLRDFLKRYIGQGELKKDFVQEDDVEMLIHSACVQGIEQELIDYGTANPDAPFWDLHKLERPGLYGVTQEELLLDDEDE